MTGQVYLLDTNVLLAALLAPNRLPQETADSLTGLSYKVYFSSAATL